MTSPRNKGYQDYEIMSPIINHRPFMNTSGFLNNSNYYLSEKNENKSNTKGEKKVYQ